MAKVRSPNYPVVDLSSALAMASKLYEKDGRNKVSKETLAAHLGHEGLSGPALGKIGALRAYGLVEGNGDENRISEDCITALMAPEGSRDKMEALRRLAFAPGLFQEVWKTFDTPPSDSNLRFWLIRRGFSPDAAAKAAKTYLATVAIVTMAERDCRASSLFDEGEAMPVPELSRTIPPVAQRFYGGEPMIASNTRREVITLDQGEVVITFPENLSAESFDDLEAHLEIFLRKLRRRVAPPSHPQIFRSHRTEDDEDI
jgi:hypothetical protein